MLSSLRSFFAKDITQNRRFLLCQILVFVAIQCSFFLSNFYVVQADQVHVLSFTAAFIMAIFLKYSWRVIPGVVSGLLFYYSHFSHRALVITLLFSTALPAIPLLFSTIYQRIILSFDAHNFPLRLVYYILVLGLAYPIANSLLLISISDYFGAVAQFDIQFLFYSVLSGALTQLVLTPLFTLVIHYLAEGSKAPYIQLDKAMHEDSLTSYHYRLWFTICVLVCVFTLFGESSLYRDTMSLLLICLVGVGIGKYGLVRPVLFATFVLLLTIEDGVSRLNQGILSERHFYGILLVLFVMTALMFMLGAHSIKNYLTTREAIVRERIDPYTGLFNLAQMREDIEQSGHVVLIFINLTPTVSKLSSLGHRGRAQLIKQLSHYLNEKTQYIKRCYLPPFSEGLVCYVPRLPYLNSELKSLIRLLDQFHFYFQDTSISLVKRTIHCTDLKYDQDLESLVSSLCEQYSDAQTDIKWLNQHTTPYSELEKLNFIQSCFKNNQFELYCQPYRNLHGRLKEEYFEVLLRLKVDGQTMMSPAEFFPLINEFGLEVELDKWVVSHTFISLSRFVDNWQSIGRCSINLTAKALSDDSLVKEVVSLAQQYGVPLDKICFEITESDALRDEAQAILAIEQLRKIGCTIALDDFGTGYASFDYLRRLPLDIIKIDGSFVQEITHSDRDKTIVQAISQVAKTMNLTTVAEFVESEQHAAILCGLGIDYAQGFGIAKPLTLMSHLKRCQKGRAI